MKRTLLILAAGALALLASVAPAFAQSDPWSGSSFDDSDLDAGAGTRTSSTFTVSGSFEHSGRDIVDVTASISAPDAACTPETSQPTASGTRSSAFALTVSSTCNIETATLTLTAKARRSCNVWNVCDTPPNGTLSTQLRIAAPAMAVTGLDASVADATSTEVAVSWAYPEGAAAETTYRVVRVGPLPGSTVVPESTDDEDGDDGSTDAPDDTAPESTTVEIASGTADTLGTSLVDTVEFNGVYTYQVSSTRPLVDPVATSVDVRVGPGPTIDDDDDDDDDGTTTTITLPDERAPISVPRRSGGGRVSSHTTVATVPRSPVTTIDTGYEERLDYHLDEIEPGELAAEGQSILSSDDPSNVIGPGAVGAAALVLLGWAGHYVYFRRLAAQF